MRTDTKEIDPKVVLKDIKTGMCDSDLKEKHGLSTIMLRNVAKELLRQRPTVSEDQPDKSSRKADPEDSVIWHIRGTQRHYTPFWVSVYDEARREIGHIGDLSEEGLSIEGVEAKVNEIRTFLVLAEEFQGIEPIEFEAACRWVKKEDNNGDCVAGFEITRISEEDMVEYRKLIDLAALGQNRVSNI